MIKVILSISTIFFLIGCQQEKNKQEYMQAEASKNIGKYSNVTFINDEDVVCKMKLSSGISDTAHYNNQVYGFCCKFCKNDFLKDPERFQIQHDNE